MAKKTHMSMTVNGWSVEWNSDPRSSFKTCALKINCAGEPTQGQAVFSEFGRIAVVANEVAPSCCCPCAVGYTTREGLKGTITIKQMFHALNRGENA